MLWIGVIRNRKQFCSIWTFRCSVLFLIGNGSEFCEIWWWWKKRDNSVETEHPWRLQRWSKMKKKRITKKRFLLVKDNVGKTEKSRLNVKWHDMTCFYWWDMNWDIREWWFKSNNLKKVTCEYIKLSYFFIIFHDDILKLYKSTCGRYTIYHIYFVDDLFLFRETLISQYNLKVS